MTIRQQLEVNLVNHGLWPQEAAAVMDLEQSSKANEPMQGRWNDDTTGYPPQIMAIAWLSAKTQAIEYLQANKPQHFALAILTHESP